MNYYWFNRQELLQKAKDRYHNGGGKEEDANKHYISKKILQRYYIKILQKKKQKVGIETCQKKKNKQKESISEKDIT